MKSNLKNFSLLTVSTLIMAAGIYFFKFANNFTFGGITGLAVTQLQLQNSLLFQPVIFHLLPTFYCLLSGGLF